MECEQDFETVVSLDVSKAAWSVFLLDAKLAELLGDDSVVMMESFSVAY